MGLKRELQKVIKQLTGISVYGELPRGVSIGEDIQRHLPGYPVTTIFDIGANVGQSTKGYLRAYPSATVYSFEPIAESYEQLATRMQDQSRARCYMLALGASVGEGTMTSTGTSVMNSLVQNGPVSGSANTSAENDTDTEEVTVSTLDAFCRDNDVEHISYLKIDTEGSDLDVLMGGVGMLAAKQVDILEVESGMSPTNTRHVPFERLKAFLEEHGYYVFGIYEQVKEWPEGQPHLRRTNAVYISDKVIREYTSTG